MMLGTIAAILTVLLCPGKWQIVLPASMLTPPAAHPQLLLIKAAHIIMKF